MREIPIYRPEITVAQREPDGVWVASHGTVTNTLFYPLADEDGLTEAGFHKLVQHGTEPFYTILAPEGCDLIQIGRAWYLKTVDGKKHDAVNALVYAKRKQFGLRLKSPGPNVETWSPLPPPELDLVAPSRCPSLPTRQLSLF